MQEQLVGKIDLTRNQEEQLSSLHTENIRGLRIELGRMYVVARNPLDSAEIEALMVAAEALPDIATGIRKEREDFELLNKLSKKTPDEARAWVMEEVNSLEKAKNVLAEMAAGFAYILRRLGL